jgi:distribution and morphology protein 31
MPQFHRPTKEELMAAATGFWSRMRVRLKWSTIRSIRPYNMDEITGFLSWIFIGHLLWLVIGTTTFVSLAILAINTIFAQETLAGWIANYLTKSSGMKVVFESAVVPKWGDGVITFKNVFVSRRPGQNKKAGVTKGSAEAAAIAAAAQKDGEEEDTNYTQFDVIIGEVNVTLSFRKWWNSKGLLQNVEVKHVRGVVDRTHVHWTGEYVDPKSYRHEHNPGDFEIDSFKIEDLLVTIHQPNDFRPFPVSIYNAELPRLRKQWMFFDLLSANSMTGEYDTSLFTIHPRQTNSYTGAQLGDPESMEDEPWKKQSRIRLDALNIDHLNRNVEGPFSWIHEGNVDIVADIMIPNDTDESVMKVMSDFYDRMEATLTSRQHLQAARDDQEFREQVSEYDTSPDNNEDKHFMVMDLRVHLNDVKAVVPIFTKDLSYVNNALIRPIVA